MCFANDFNGLLQVTELHLTLSSGTNTMALVLCDFCYSWVFFGLAVRLSVQGNSLKLTVKGINLEELIDSEVVQLTVAHHKIQDFEVFTVCLCVGLLLNVGRDNIDAKPLQKTYSYLSVLYSLKYSWGDFETIIGQDVYQTICPLVYFSANKSNHLSLFAYQRLGFKYQDHKLACQVKSLYNIELNGMYKQVGLQSEGMLALMKYLKQQVFIMAE